MKIFLLILGISLTEVIESRVSGTFTTVQTGPKPIWKETFLDKLKKDLLPNYDKFLRPENHNHTTIVKIGLSVFVLETYEDKNAFDVEGMIHLEWTDSKLKWSPSDYGGLSVIRIGDHEVWQPDIHLYNSAVGGGQLSRAGSKNVVVHSTGTVHWVPPVKLTALCNYDLRKWPFDTQHCHLKFGSWTASSEQIKLLIMNNATEAEIEDTIKSSPWIVNTTVTLIETRYSCCSETYESVQYNFTLIRKATPYYSIVVTPAVVATFMILAQFWLPPYVGQKIFLNGFAAVILNFFLLYFGSRVVSIGPSTPALVLYYSKSLYILIFTTSGAVATYLMCVLQKREPPPFLIRTFLKGRCGKWILFEQYSLEMFPGANKGSTEDVKRHHLSENRSSPVDDIRSLECLIQNEWIALAVCIDRIFFVIFSIAYIALAISLS